MNLRCGIARGLGADVPVFVFEPKLGIANAALVGLACGSEEGTANDVEGAEVGKEGIFNAALDVVGCAFFSVNSSSTNTLNARLPLLAGFKMLTVVAVLARAASPCDCGSPSLTLNTRITQSRALTNGSGGRRAGLCGGSLSGGCGGCGGTKGAQRGPVLVVRVGASSHRTAAVQAQRLAVVFELHVLHLLLHVLHKPRLKGKLLFLHFFNWFGTSVRSLITAHSTKRESATYLCMARS